MGNNAAVKKEPSMKHMLASTVLTVVLFAGELPAAEPLKSGIPVGQGNRGRFLPTFITGTPGCPV
jgi:hypothetical protein